MKSLVNSSKKSFPDSLSFSTNVWRKNKLLEVFLIHRPRRGHNRRTKAPDDPQERPREGHPDNWRAKKAIEFTVESFNRSSFRHLGKVDDRAPGWAWERILDGVWGNQCYQESFPLWRARTRSNGEERVANLLTLGQKACSNVQVSNWERVFVAIVIEKWQLCE